MKKEANLATINEPNKKTGRRKCDQHSAGLKWIFPIP